MIIVVDNRTTAITGHQEHPGTGRTLMREQTISASVEEFGRACGMKNIATVDPYDLKATTETLRHALESNEPWLIVSRSPCPLYTRKSLGPARQVTQEMCRKCKACLKLGCPAIEYVIVPVDDHRTRDDLGGKENALPSHTDQHDARGPIHRPERTFACSLTA